MIKNIQSLILEELSYTDMTEERLSEILKTPVRRELARMEREDLVKKVMQGQEERWSLI